MNEYCNTYTKYLLKKEFAIQLQNTLQFWHCNTKYTTHFWKVIFYQYGSEYAFD